MDVLRQDVDVAAGCWNHVGEVVCCSQVIEKKRKSGFTFRDAFQSLSSFRSQCYISVNWITSKNHISILFVSEGSQGGLGCLFVVLDRDSVRNMSHFVCFRGVTGDWDVPNGDGGFLLHMFVWYSTLQFCLFQRGLKGDWDVPNGAGGGGAQGSQCWRGELSSYRFHFLLLPFRLPHSFPTLYL